MKQSINYFEAEAKYHHSISKFNIWTLLAIDAVLVGSLVLGSYLL